MGFSVRAIKGVQGIRVYEVWCFTSWGEMFCEYIESEMHGYYLAKLCKACCGSGFTPDILFVYPRKLEIKL